MLIAVALHLAQPERAPSGGERGSLSLAPAARFSASASRCDSFARPRPQFHRLPSSFCRSGSLAPSTRAARDLWDAVSPPLRTIRQNARRAERGRRPAIHLPRRSQLAGARLVHLPAARFRVGISQNAVAGERERFLFR